MRLVPSLGRRVLGYAATLLTVGGLVAAHLHVERGGLSYTGPWLFVDHLFDLVMSLAVLAVCFGAGRLALRRLGPALDRPLEILLLSTAVGVGIVAIGILGLGFAGVLRPTALVLFLVAVAVATWREICELPEVLAGGVRYAREHGGSRWLGALAVLVLVLVALFLLVFALAPPVDWDALMYHLQVPSQFLERRRIYLPEDNLRASYINLVHMLYLPLLAVGSESGPAVVSAIFALLLGVAVFSFATRFFSGATACLSVVLLWGTTTLLLVAITPRVDVTLAWYLFLAHYALLCSLEEPGNRRLFVLAGVLLGLSVGVKYHALPYLVGLSPLIVRAALVRSRGLASAVGEMAILGACVIAAALPWLLKNWILLRAPIYPVLATPLVEPWLVPLLGSRTVPEGIDPGVLQVVWDSRQAFNLWDAFFAPGRISIEFEGSFYFTNPALLALPLSLLLVRERAVLWLVVPAVGYLIALLVPFPHTNLRYLAPAVVPLTVVVAHTGVQLAERALPRAVAHAVLALLALLALGPSARTAWKWVRDTLAVEHLVGTRSAYDYMAGHVLPSARNYAPLIRFTNRHVPPDSRILMLFEGRGFYFDATVLQDHSGGLWPLLATALGPQDCLERAGVTHVLLGTGTARYYIEGGLDRGVLREEAFRGFAERCLVPIYEGPGFVLFRVRERSAVSVPPAEREGQQVDGDSLQPRRASLPFGVEPQLHETAPKATRIPGRRVVLPELYGALSNEGEARPTEAEGAADRLHAFAWLPD